MTGIADVLHTVNREAWHAAASMGLLAIIDAILYLFLPQRVSKWLVPRVFPTWHAELKAASMRWQACPRPRLPDQRQTLAILANQRVHGKCRAGTRPERLTWGILLPLTSRVALNDDGGCDEGDIWSRLEGNMRCLVESVPESRRIDTIVHVAIDMRDPVLDNDAARARIRAMLGALAGTDFAPPLPPAYQGAICWIWDLLAKRAVAAGADLFVLLGDDITMHDKAWQDDVERQFACIAAERGLPFGCACVAIRDSAFANFPTFPVVHKAHLEIFEDLFPPAFRNQHGDPFLFELYRRWGASRFTAGASLTNGVGGAGNARYTKAGENEWRGQVLTRGVEQLARWLAVNHDNFAKQVQCIDIVVPTYRCDISMLKPLCNLSCERPASIHTTLVVDRPDAPNLHEILRLASYQPDRTVRVHVMETNAGASNARNAGLWQSFGDHAILLDDDVTAQAGLVDAYLGAIERHPGAAAYVGVTKLPVPQTLMQQAMTACNICYFYGVAEEQKNPAWGVTANLCIPARTNPISFSRRYPKTGGGEDVDFCIRAQQVFGPCVAVPGARALHPFWDSPLKQVIGWASGDVLCLEALPHSTFRTPPNWVEVAFACACAGRFDLCVLAAIVEVAVLAPRFFYNAPRQNRIAVSLVATLPPMVQDVQRLLSKILRLRLTQVCLHFDWMNGAGHHVTEKRLSIVGKGIAFALAVAVLEASGGEQLRAALCLVCFYVLWCIGQVDLHIIPQVLRMPRAVESAVDIGSAPVPFVIFGYQRTGSNLLCSYLGCHPKVAMHYELFNDKAVYAHNGELHTGEDVKNRDVDPAAFLARMFSVDSRAEVLGGGRPHCVGFKVFPEHICRSKASRELFEQLLSDTRVKKIILKRENRTSVCASALRASVTGHYIKKNLDDVKVKIEAHELQAFIDNYDGYYKYIAERVAGQHGNWIDISYEELIRAPTSAVHRLCKFLDIPSVPLAHGVTREIPRQSDGVLQNALDNFDDLKHAFAGDDRRQDFE
jgi:LPS sulfotransferase NodH